MNCPLPFVWHQNLSSEPVWLHVCEALRPICACGRAFRACQSRQGVEEQSTL